MQRQGTKNIQNVTDLWLFRKSRSVAWSKCGRRGFQALGPGASGSGAMTLLDQDSFLNQLTKILEKSRGTGTIYVTFKKCERSPAPSCSTAVGIARARVPCKIHWRV